MSSNIHSILKEFWGFEKFREMQEEIIQSVLDGKDTLALLPTGGGKSICFQVPALTKDGICLVVSPLIALMKDQVENLKERGVNAETLVSGMSKRAIDILLDNCIYGKVKFLYVSPERLKSKLFIVRLKKMNVNLIAIDEAHCISQWGYNFRPSYLEIINLREILPNIPILALTATATPKVVIDIQEKLGFKKPNVLQKSFKRDNIHYIVINDEDKMGRMMKIINKVPGTGIIYALNRRKTQEIAHFLQKRGISAEYYHAGITPEKRSRIQADWSSNQTRIIVATNAFGMGIDKPDVRFVINLELTDSIEAYFQEAGRGGRDEKKAYAVLLINENDRINLINRVEKSFPKKEQIKKVYFAICNQLRIAIGTGEDATYPFNINDIKAQQNHNALEIYNSVKFLEQAGYFELSEAFYTPSRIKIEMNSSELYEFQIRNKKYDPYIKLLLRSYGGLFDDFSKIKEFDLATRSKKTISVIRKILRELHKLEVITYEEQNDLPLLTFLQPRVDLKHLRLGKEIYDNRKEEALTKLEAVINYAFSNDTCRSQLLLTYFGDSNTDCGVCDVCLSKKRDKKLNSKQFKEIQNNIITLLQNSPLEPSELIIKLASKHKEKNVRIMVQWLLDENIIKLNELNKIKIT
jgi:ATP-dependent DNA helicase RecQ